MRARYKINQSEWYLSLSANSQRYKYPTIWKLYRRVVQQYSSSSPRITSSNATPPRPHGYRGSGRDGEAGLMLIFMDRSPEAKQILRTAENDLESRVVCFMCACRLHLSSCQHVASGNGAQFELCFAVAGAIDNVRARYCGKESATMWDVGGCLLGSRLLTRPGQPFLIRALAVSKSDCQRAFSGSGVVFTP